MAPPIIWNGSYAKLLKANLNFFDSFFIINSSISTSDATPTSLYSLPLADNTVYIVKAMVVARRTDGTLGNAAFEKDVAVYRDAGGAPVISDPGVPSTLFATNSSWNFDLVFSGNSLNFQVTGQAATAVNWKLILMYQNVS